MESPLETADTASMLASFRWHTPKAFADDPWKVSEGGLFYPKAEGWLTAEDVFLPRHLLPAALAAAEVLCGRWYSPVWEVLERRHIYLGAGLGMRHARGETKRVVFLRWWPSGARTAMGARAGGINFNTLTDLVHEVEQLAQA